MQIWTTQNARNLKKKKLCKNTIWLVSSGDNKAALRIVISSILEHEVLFKMLPCKLSCMSVS